MIHSTPGIVLSRMNYSETSVIVRIYTRQFGLLSFLEKGVRKAKSKKSYLFQPLSLVEVVFHYRPEKDLQYSREITLRRKTTGIHTDMIKTSLSFFVAELTYKTIRDREENPLLYDFLENSTLFLNSTDESVANFHLVFMVRLAAISGFGIEERTDENLLYFNLEQGQYSAEPSHLHFADEQPTAIISKTAKSNYLTMNEIKISSEDRNEVLDNLLTFFYLQNEGMQEVKSAEVLREVFGNQ